MIQFIEMKEFKFSPFKQRIIYAFDLLDHYRLVNGNDPKLREDTKNMDTPQKNNLEPVNFSANEYRNLRKYKEYLFKEQIDIPKENEIPTELNKYKHDVLTWQWLDFELFVQIIQPLSIKGTFDDKIKCMDFL
jgi:hypothetical protein